MTTKTDVGVISPAVMGRNPARNFARPGFTVALYNRSGAKAPALTEEFGHERTLVPTDSAAGFLAALERPRRLVITVQPAATTDAVIEQLTPMLEPGDVITDDGDSHFADDEERHSGRGHIVLHAVRHRRGGLRSFSGHAADPRLPTPSADEKFVKGLGAAQDAWREVVTTGARLGIPTPGFCAALASSDTLQSESLPTALTHPRREFFGAHTYRRVVQEGSFHIQWGGDRVEERIE
ncbi:NAD(P)-binding domain-containing protein [Streptomyces sp. CA-106110]|uniref:NAD(P)-binding domain-containing protein n=1 Tax=Streptomyces sp. CA-106110 TaxID=3240044 RepID=UPI003D8C629E